MFFQNSILLQIFINITHITHMLYIYFLTIQKNIEKKIKIFFYFVFYFFEDDDNDESRMMNAEGR